MKNQSVVFSVLSAFLFFPFTSDSREQPVVFGKVSDALSKEPLSNVRVQSVENHALTFTNSRGTYRLVLPGGNDTLICVCVGYASQRFPVKVSPGDSLRRDIMLVPSTLLFDEVTVTAGRNPLTPVHGLGGISISPRQTENISGAFGDVYRTIQSMAGVASNNEMSSQFSIRGGAVDENLMQLNGATLIEPFHLKEAPNSSVSIVNVDLLQKVLFVPGGFTARYGDRLSAVVDMEMREGNKDHFAGQAEASLTNAGVVVEGPLAENATALASLRSSYSDYISRYLPDGDQRRPFFYDVQASLGTDLSDRHHLSSQILYSSDRTTGLTNGGYTTTLVTLQSTYTLPGQSSLVSQVSFYKQTENITYGFQAADSLPVTSRDDNFTVSHEEARLRFDSHINDLYSLTAGFDLQFYQYDLMRTELPVVSSLNIRSDKLSAYAENLFRLTDAILLNGGLRVDYSALTSTTKISPRLLAAYHFPKGTTLKAAWGLYTQTPTYQQLLAASEAGDPPQHEQRAVHYIVGVEQPLRNNVALSVDLYYKKLSDLISSNRLQNGALISSPRNNAEGYARGAEIEFTITDPRVTAWINLALMESRERDIGTNGPWRYRPNDQLKTVTTIFEYHVARFWLLNLRAYYGSGFAYVNDLPGFADTRQHYPDYKRVDARINYSFNIDTFGCILYLEVMNMFNFKNAYSFQAPAADERSLDYNLLLPRVVNVGAKVRF